MGSEMCIRDRLKGVGPGRAKTAVEPRLQGVGPSRAKTMIRMFAGGLPLLLKIMPVVGRMAEAVPACNVAVWALAKAPLVSRESITKRVHLWC